LKLQTLKSYARMDKRMEEKKESLARLKSEREKTTSTLSDMPRSEGYDRDKLLRQTAQIIDLEAEIRDDILYLESVKREVDAWLETLEANEEKVMTLRYINGMSWGKVADQAGYSENGPYKVQESMIKKGKLETV